MAEKGANSSAQSGEEFYNDGQYNGPGILVGRAGRTVIMPDQPLPEYDSPTALAYHCVSRADSNRSLIAMICAPKFPARYDILTHMRGNISGVLRVADWGLAQFPGEDGPRLVIVMDRPGGPRVMANLTSKNAPISEENLVNFFLMPALMSLKELGARNVSHRGIRPTNIFYTDPSRRMMMLGDCVTSPPAYNQPDSFETIESAMCSPIGRGSGGISEDLYSLGVTMLSLLLGYDPMGERSQETLLEQKIEMGSYTALVGQARVPIGVMEALRGLLNDTVRERWTLNDLEMWIDGRRLSPRQPKMPHHSARPFNFIGRDYSTARGLSMALATHFDQAPMAIRTKILDGWVRRSLGDEIRANALQSALSATANNATGRNSEDRLVARVCIALDPEAPIRFRGFGVNVDGLAYALSASTDNADLRRILTEIIHARLAVAWVGLQERPMGEALRLAQMLDRMPQIIDNVQPGFGMERVLYELSQAEPCHSP
ncbi:MAG: serine/threonine protein kinase, partial [Alphaproteobacteria bacterium]|nr:serine/threonine protein kinase [Alphaproteobacteria bacterium]